MFSFKQRHSKYTMYSFRVFSRRKYGFPLVLFEGVLWIYQCLFDNFFLNYINNQYFKGKSVGSSPHMVLEIHFVQNYDSAVIKGTSFCYQNIFYFIY